MFVTPTFKPKHGLGDRVRLAFGKVRDNNLYVTAITAHLDGTYSYECSEPKDGGLTRHTFNEPEIEAHTE